MNSRMMVKNLRSVQPIAACSTAAVVATSIGIHDSRTNDHNSSRNDFYRRCLRYLLRQETDTTITSSSTSTDEVVSTSHRDPIPVLDLAVSSWQYYFQTPTTLFKTAAPIQWPLVPCLVNGTTKTFSAHHCYLDIIQLLYYYTNHHPFNIQRNLMKESYCNKNTSIILAYSPMNTTTTTTTASGQITTTVGSVLRSIPRHVVKFIQTIRDVVLVAIRATEIGVILSPFLLVLGPASTLMSSSLSHNPPQDSSWLSQKIESIMWSYLLYTVPMLGPAFVKLTQWAATRRDLFSSKICDQLSLIQTSNPVVHSWAHTDQMLREAFGSNYSQYLHIHHPKDNILGSGCVAQVYRGELIVEDDNSHPSSSSSGYRRKIPVAIKVLHPHISEKIDRDLTFMKRVAYLVETLLPSSALCAVNLPRVVEHFEDIIRRQVDLRIEAQNLREFHANFPTTNDNRTNSPTIEFPKPLLESKNVLVEELISAATEEEIEEEEPVVDTSSISFFSTGAKQQQRRIIRKTTTVLPISAFLSDNSTEGLLVRKNLARPLLKSFLKMLFKDNFVHCDLHAGNVYVKTTTTTTVTSTGNEQPSNAKKTVTQQYTIIFLDAGIATSLSPQSQENLRDLFKAVVLNDGETAGRLMVERARYERCSQIEGGVEAFSKGISDLVSEFHDHRKHGGLTLGAVRIGELLGKVLDLCRLYGVEIDPSMSSVVLSTVILEGLGRSLEPNLNLIEFAIPFLVSGYQGNQRYHINRDKYRHCF